MAGQLFQRFIENREELDVVIGTEYTSVGVDPNNWRRPRATEFTEWQALFDAIEDATHRLTMVEVGAGLGRWTVNAALALRQYRPEIKHRLIAIEPEPTHYRWLKQHVRNNGLRRWSSAGTCKLIQAAVSREGGHDRFFFGNPREWYGQALVRPENEGADAPITEVRTLTLSSLLPALDCVDLVDLDIQGAELEVLTEAAPALANVRRIHVETHSAEIDERLPQMLEGAAGNWRQEIAIPLGAQYTTPLGDAEFTEGGVQLWRNDSR